jgi:L-lactate dehydrogenase complex protein LldG
VDLFIDRLRDYTAQAERVAAAEVGRAVREACARMGLARVAVAPGIPDDWRPGGAVTVLEDDGLSAAELDRLDGIVTGCAAAIAETGTIVLDGRPPSGRRVLTLVPDHHICLLTAEQIVGQVPEAIAALAPAVTGERVPVTFVSGASATSDIELERVEGVHGPRHLLVLVLV